MKELEPEPLKLGLLLGLNLSDPAVCHGFSVGCDCADCRGRSELVSPSFLSWLESEPPKDPMSDRDMPPRYWKRAPKPSQPWHLRPAA